MGVAPTGSGKVGVHEKSLSAATEALALAMLRRERGWEVKEMTSGRPPKKCAAVAPAHQ